MSLDQEYLEAARRTAADAVRELTASGVPERAIELVRPALTTITLDPAGKLYCPTRQASRHGSYLSAPPISLIPQSGSRSAIPRTSSAAARAWI